MYTEKMRKRKREEVDYDFSGHSKERMNKRDFSEAQLELALKNGKRKHHGGKILVTYQGRKVVLSSDQTTIITCYRKGT